MKKRHVIGFFLLVALPVQADPFDRSGDALFGFGAGPIESTSNPFIEELGRPGSYQTQSQAVELLGNEFSRAAAQGLVEAQEAPSMSTDRSIRNTLEGRSNLSVITGLDRDILTTPSVPPTAAGAICLADRDVDLTEWGDTADSKQLGKLRTEAIAENGDMTPDGALKLARYYIALGFGAEAKALVRYIDDQKDRDVVSALASIVDIGASSDTTLQGQIFCEGKVAFWAALAQPISATDIPLNTNAIMSAFAELPLHLRSHLGPFLAERLQNAGLEEQARQVLNAILRSGTKSDESALETAKIALSSPQPEKARQQLKELSNGTDVVAAKALLELLDDALSREVQPFAEWVEDVPSLVRATEGTQVSKDLNIAGLYGLISLQRFDEVRLALNEDTPGLTDQTRPEIAAKALAAATEHASNEVFLRSLVGLGKHFAPESLSSQERYALAERLSDLGLSERAAAYLPTQPDSITDRRTSSRVLAGIGQTTAAQNILEDASNEALQSELASLLAKEGKVDEALVSFAEIGQSDAATLLAVQAGYWDWIETNGEDRISEATQALRMTLENDTTEPMNGALIQLAKTRRDQAKRLLETLENQKFPDIFTN